MDILDRLLGHDYATTRDLLLQSRRLSDGQLDQTFDMDHGSVRATFAHMIENVATWSDLIDERPADRRGLDTSVVGMIRAHERTYGEFADLARKIRDELAAMEVMSVNPVHRLVTPRLWAASTVGLFLVSLVSVAGIAGGYFFNVVIQKVTPGAYFQGFTSLVQLPDLYSSLAKAWVFGFIAAMVACYKGIYAKGGPKGVGDAVNQAVVITFILIFFANFIMTSLYFALAPQKF